MADQEFKKCGKKNVVRKKCKERMADQEFKKYVVKKCGEEKNMKRE